jgi:hypothetical protein
MASCNDLFQPDRAILVVGLACCQAPFELETKCSVVPSASRATMSKSISGSPAREPFGKAGDDSSSKVVCPLVSSILHHVG